MNEFEGEQFLQQLGQYSERLACQRRAARPRRARAVRGTPVAVAATALERVGLIPPERLRSIVADPSAGWRLERLGGRRQRHELHADRRCRSG